MPDVHKDRRSKDMQMATSTCIAPDFSILPSHHFVKQELRRIPNSVRIGLHRLGLSQDLEQELHLAYYEKQSQKSNDAGIKKALHAAGERFRYREIVRRAKREVPEEFAGAAYHSLMYGEVPEPGQGSDS